MFPDLSEKMKKESSDDVGGRCVLGNDGTHYLHEDRAKVRKAHMQKIINEENELDQTADADTVEGLIERVMREEIMEAFKHLKIGKAPGSTEVYPEMILASGDVGIRVDGTFPENTRWKKNDSKLGYLCCI